MIRTRVFTALGLTASVALGTATAEERFPIGLTLTSGLDTVQPTQVSTDAAGTVGTWSADPIFTVGESRFGYTPGGILDGMGAFTLPDGFVRVLVNHEFSSSVGYPYPLANGTMLTGARVSYFDITPNRKLVRNGAAYDTIIDRYGDEVTSGYQITEGEGSSETDGIGRLCSANFYEAGEYSLEDAIFFTGEEQTGGQEFALDPTTGILHCVPWLGRAAWESVCLVDTGDDDTIGAIVGDDRQGAPLILYVGLKNHLGDGSFLDRNGLAYGQLYIWAADDGSTNPDEWNGTGTSRTGTFVAIEHHDAAMAGMPGYDDQGFADQATQDAQVDPAGGFHFSRPEDVHANPADGTQIAFASTGRGSAYPSDNWGTLYVIDVDFGETITAELTILYDGDDAGAGQFTDPDFGLRSPDNLEWAEDGMIYVQEDRSTSPSSLFGGVSGIEASIWQVHPSTGELTRIATTDRSAIPADQEDFAPGDIGNWETSGVIDVTSLFPTTPGETLLMGNVEAHSLGGGRVEELDLVQGGQLFFMSNAGFGGRLAAGLNPAVDPGLGASPNPFRASTSIRFQLAEAGEVTARIYDATGREVSALSTANLEAGVHAISWDGRDTAGRALPAGVYYAEIATATGTATQKLMRLR